MIIVARKNSDPAVIHAITEGQVEQYPEADWVHNPASYMDLIESGLTPEDLAVDDDDVFERAIDPAVALAEAKAAKVTEIDAYTTGLIESGFSYGGKQFSLSRQAQSNLAGMRTAINGAKVQDIEQPGYFAGWQGAVFPLTFNTLDDADITELADAAAFNGFYDTALGTVKAYLDGGTGLKSAVRAATTVEQVDEIVVPS